MPCDCFPFAIAGHPQPQPPAPPDNSNCPPDTGAPWVGEPTSGDSFAARIRTVSTSTNFLGMANDGALPGPFLPLNTSFTAGCFIKLLVDHAASDIMCRWTGGGNEQWLLGYDGAAKNFYCVIIDAGGGTSGVPVTAAVSLNVWYLVAMSFDALAGKVRIWLNGVQSNVNHAAGMKSVPAGMLIGMRGAGGTAADFLIESAWVHRGTVWNDAQMLHLFNSNLGVRDNRWFHFGLPMPTVLYEFENGGNLGYNSMKDPLYDLTNSPGPGGLAGLVTQDIGLPYS